MLLKDLIQYASYAGAVVGVVFIILGLLSLVGLVSRDDDDFQPIGEADPSPPRRSPFVSEASGTSAWSHGDSSPPAGSRRG